MSGSSPPELEPEPGAVRRGSCQALGILGVDRAAVVDVDADNSGWRRGRADRPGAAVGAVAVVIEKHMPGGDGLRRRDWKRLRHPEARSGVCGVHVLFGADDTSDRLAALQGCERRSARGARLAVLAGRACRSCRSRLGACELTRPEVPPRQRAVLYQGVKPACRRRLSATLCAPRRSPGLSYTNLLKAAL